MTKNEIIAVLRDWNFWGEYQNPSCFPRKSYVDRLMRLINLHEIAVVTGVRRCGKSTIIAQLVESRLEETGINNHLIINFEDPRLVDANLKDVQKIYEIYQKEIQPAKDHLVVLDEVQSVPKWEKFARYLLEAKRVWVIVTGSSSKLLSSDFATVITGRHVDMEVFPLTFAEFLGFKKIDYRSSLDEVKNRFLIHSALKEFLEWGGFPKVAVSPQVDKKNLLRSYFTDILVKDVEKRYQIKEKNKLEKLASYYLTNCAAFQSFNNLSKVFNLSQDTIERFSSWFVEVGLFDFVPKFSYSLKSQLQSERKIYAIDLGLRQAAGFEFMPEWGRRFENAVWFELKKRGREIYYGKFGSYPQKEIDFVVKKGNLVHELIQVCYQMTDFKTRKRELENLAKASVEYRCDNLTVITDEEEGEEMVKGKKIKIVPIGKWLTA